MFHSVVTELSGIDDPFRDIKDRSTELGLALLPELRRDETHLADLLKRIDMPEPEEQSEDASMDGGRSSQMRATVNKRWHDSKWEKAYG